MECPDQVLAAPHVVVVGDEGAAGHHPAHNNSNTSHYTLHNSQHPAHRNSNTSHNTLSLLLAPVAELLQRVQEHVGLGPELDPAVDLLQGTV